MLNKASYYLLLLFAATSVHSIAAANVTLFLGLSLGLIRYVTQPVTVKLDRRLLYLLGLFFASLLISVAFSYNKVNSVKEYFSLASRVIPIFLPLLVIQTKRQVVQLVSVLIWSLAIGDLVAIWQRLQWGERATGMRGSPITFAGYVELVLPVILVWLTAETGRFIYSPKIKLVLIISLFLSILALLATGTRGAWLAVATSIIVNLMYSKLSKRKLYVTAILVTLAFSVFVVSPVMQNRLHSIADLDDPSNFGRLVLWQSAWEMFKDHPFTGVGLRNFNQMYNEHYPQPGAEITEHTQAHNTVLHLLAETGAVSTLAFISLFGYIILINLRSGDEWGLIAALITINFVVHGMFDYTFRLSVVSRLYWVLLGLTYAARQVQWEKQKNETYTTQ